MANYAYWLHRIDAVVGLDGGLTPSDAGWFPAPAGGPPWVLLAASTLCTPLAYGGTFDTHYAALNPDFEIHNLAPDASAPFSFIGTFVVANNDGSQYLQVNGLEQFLFDNSGLTDFVYDWTGSSVFQVGGDLEWDGGQIIAAGGGIMAFQTYSQFRPRVAPLIVPFPEGGATPGSGLVAGAALHGLVPRGHVF